jgi:hypothetical protein
VSSTLSAVWLSSPASAAKPHRHDGKDQQLQAEATSPGLLLAPRQADDEE